MAEMIERVAEGFPRQRIDCLPPAVVAHYQSQPIIRDLMPIWAGHFPEAKNHFIDRKDGMDHSLLMWCVAGEGWVRTASAESVLRAGDFVVLPAGSAHAYGSGARTPWTIYWFHFIGERMQDYIDLLSGDGPLLVRRISLDAELIELFEALIRSHQRGHTREDMLVAGSLAARTMVRMHSLLRGRGKEKQTIRTIDRATRFMRENLSATFSLDELAANSFSSISHLNRLFRESTGFPPMAYFTQLRMVEACRLLATTDAKISAVAIEVGYADPYHFSRVFKRVIGYSPSAYRQEH